MPNFDCGAYFLSTLVPVKTEPVIDSATGEARSPVHLLRAELANLATAQQTPYCEGQSPFARNLRNHFVRLVVIEDVAYVGRRPIDPFLTVLSELLLPPRLRINPVRPQTQDHLSCPFLFFCVDFDAASGEDSERDSYLKELWTSAEPELRRVFQYCVRFDEDVRDAESFARYVARCQLTTTMPFHDYFMDPIPLKKRPESFLPEPGRLPEISIWTYTGVFLGVAAAAYLLLRLLFEPTSHPVWLLHVLLGVAAGTAAIVVMGTRAGEKPFPAEAGSTLPDVLKALYLKEQFTRFATDNQLLAVEEDEASARRLQENFKAFVATHRPQDNGAPTQSAGVVGKGA